MKRNAVQYFAFQGNAVYYSLAKYSVGLMNLRRRVLSKGRGWSGVV